MKKRWLLISICMVLIAVGTAAVVLWNTSWGRLIRGISQLEVINLSPYVFEKVTVTARDGSGRQYSNSARRLEPGEVIRLAVRTSDLFLKSITWHKQGTPCRFSEGGLACRGETLVIEVFDNERAKVRYRR